MNYAQADQDEVDDTRDSVPLSKGTVILSLQLNIPDVDCDDLLTYTSINDKFHNDTTPLPQMKQKGYQENCE